MGSFLLQKISASYSPREDICVLTAGEDMDWFDDMPDKMVKS